MKEEDKVKRRNLKLPKNVIKSFCFGLVAAAMVTGADLEDVVNLFLNVIEKTNIYIPVFSGIRAVIFVVLVIFNTIIINKSAEYAEEKDLKGIYTSIAMGLINIISLVYLFFKFPL